ncbi:MAG: FHA domain-containing protein [Oscillospiraceae bacterium]|jgi:hypothetical protein|nr:FHA domain-containing protein [Oscillospiraceae bacterium]
MYEIQSKSDFQAGATLIVRIPEEEVDKKALYTILDDQPDFVLPFRHRVIDGQIEFTYQVGNRSKLAYLSGNRSPGEYADLWIGILQPLLDCGDWFMTPYSFVLKYEYLYCDKNGRVDFVYIPSVRACSDYSALKSMVTEVAKQNRVTDIDLENRVIWAIQDFNPNELLQMVRPYKTNPVSNPIPQQNPAPQPYPQPMQPGPPAAQPPMPQPAAEYRPVAPVPAAGTQRKPDDIAINFQPNWKAPKEERPKSAKKEKELRPPPPPKEKGGLSGKKKTQQQEIIGGAAAMPRPDSVPGHPVVPAYAPPMYVDDPVTELDDLGTNAPKFRYIGNGEHPRIIEINIAGGEVFTIGRFDVSVGVKQSSFEFDKRTKAVGRRHAAVERNADGYIIVDLSSQAGTYINGQKLPPNAPFKLEPGCRVSFGYSGADYVWEE